MNEPTDGWRTASASGQTDCVEVRWRIDDATARQGSALVRLRDSKNPDGGMLTLTGGSFVAFLAGVRSGRLPRRRC
ncbi:DUF397 domain-containing protein [Actinoalloteichus hymeniacidonis]|uniref:DUF397 family protein n=1 Tax=Actinoalloteichus hymeniacidonis TaxID=340345 RepID=A0AAC9HLY3_9PSEU|nr:DUF397 domain-containing protein [Actinoalloteichus hymeniacidonis]AOS61747.1 putative DUF397 family protein [Actinoalloteichus hymeniacidonis]MBB5910235.1 hypothetical protein [Actinoalloteichus hymeniacidonis]